MNSASARAQRPRLLPRSVAAVVYIAIAATAYLCIFRLPFHVASDSPRIRSTSYAVGFNSRVAIAAVLAFMGLATLLIVRRFAPRPPWTSPVKPVAISPIVVGSMALAYLALTVLIYAGAQSAESYGIEWESSHFLWRMKLTTAYGLRPYSGYQFEYGPALAYLPLLLYSLFKPLGLSHEIIYYGAHYMFNVAGLIAIAFVLQSTIMPARTREIALVALGSAAFLPNMGLNGVVLRYTAPFFGLVLLHRTVTSPHRFRNVRVLVAAIGSAALCIGLSAEIGLAFVAVLTVYAVCSVSTRGLLWPLITAVVVITLAAPWALPGQYFASLTHFSQGGNNLPLLPTSPHLLLYLLTMIWLVPKWLAGITARSDEGTLSFALGMLTVVLMPGALGRCDPYHVMFYSLGASMLAFIYLAKADVARFRAYTIVYLLVFFVGLEVINAWVFGLTPRAVANWAAHRSRGPSTAAGDLNPLLKYDQVALPYGSYGYSKPTQEWLWAHRKVAPEYYMGGMGIYTESQIADRRIDLGRFRYALVHDAYLGLHKHFAHEPCVSDRYYLRKALVYPWRLPCVHSALDPDGEISRYLETSYHVVERVGEYFVSRRMLQLNQSPTRACGRLPHRRHVLLPFSVVPLSESAQAL